MKKKILLIILLLIITFPVLASTNTKDRNSVDNYGVTKFKVTNENKQYILSTPYVDASEKIYDFSDILTDEEEQSFIEKIEDFREKTGFDLVILTDNKYYSSDNDNEMYAADFYDFNDFLKDGIIFYRNTYEEDPYYSLVSSGDAQLYYYDTRIDSILDEIYDNIHDKEYVEGINQLIELLYEDYDSGKLDNYFVDNDGYLRNKDEYEYDKNGNLVKKVNWAIPIGSGVIVGIIVSAISVGTMVSKNKMIRVATKATGYADRNSIKYAVKQDNFINTVTTSHYISHDSSSGGGGGHSSFGGHSGGGHSGGGRHG